MTPRELGRVVFSLFVIFSATMSALSLLYGFGVRDVTVLSIVGGAVFFGTMRLIDRSSSS